MKKVWLTPEMRMAQYAVNETMAANASNVWDANEVGEGAVYDLGLG